MEKCRKEAKSVILKDSKGNLFESIMANRKGDALLTFKINDPFGVRCRCTRPTGHEGKHSAKIMADGIEKTVEWGKRRGKVIV